MRFLVYIWGIVTFLSCGQEHKAVSRHNNNSVSIDTLTVGNYVLTLENCDSFPETDIYGDLVYRRKLADSIGNWHNRAIEIQTYLIDHFGDKFYITDTSLVLNLSNGNTLSFANWDSEQDEGYTFENYFEEIDYYLLRVQWSEGNCWMLINRKNGFKRYIGGLPHISTDSKHILSINTDLEAGYSFNGLELYSIAADSLQKEFSKETVWGPIDVKWINEKQFLLKREHFQVDSISGRQKYFIDFKQVTIEKKASQ
jgi:hypothetical protein